MRVQLISRKPLIFLIDFSNFDAEKLGTMEDNLLDGFSAADQIAHEFMSIRPSSPLIRINAYSGWSGACLWRFEAQSEQWVLRAWPSTVQRQQLQWIHNRLLHAQRSRLSFVPQLWIRHDGQTTLKYDNRLWDVSKWLPGAPVQSNSVENAHLTAAMMGLAQLHQTWADSAETIHPLPCIHKRWQQLNHFDEQWILSLLHQKKLSRNRTSWVQRAFQLITKWRGYALRTLWPWLDKPLTVQTVHGDLWSEHLLFLHQHLTGIVDYGSCRMDHPAVDLARLLGSWLPMQRPMWSVALAIYQSVRRLPEETWSLLGLLEWTGRLVGVAQWLDRLLINAGAYPAISRPLQQLAWIRLQNLITEWADPQ